MNRLAPATALLLTLVAVAAIASLADFSGKSDSKSHSQTEILKPFEVSNAALPEAKLITMSEKEVSLAEIAKNYQLVNFVSSQCSHCQDVMQVSEKYANKFKIAWIAVGASYQKSKRKALMPFIKEADFYLDKGGTVYSQMNLTIPSSLFFEGEVLKYSFKGAIQEAHLKALSQ